MKNKSLQGKLRIGGLALSMVLGVIALSVTTASAQYRGDDKNDKGRDNSGYGKRDDDGWKDHDKKRDDKDRYGNDNYGNDRYGNSGGYGNDRYGNGGYNYERALIQQAFQDGAKAGFMDARRGKRFNAHKAAAYAMNDIRFGGYSRQMNYGRMKHMFREAFMRGYEKGYDDFFERDGWGRNGNRARRGF